VVQTLKGGTQRDNAIPYIYFVPLVTEGKCKSVRKRVNFGGLAAEAGELPRPLFSGIPFTPLSTVFFSMALPAHSRPWPLIQFRNHFFTECRTHWKSDQTVASS
jgi:hypothetical protein